MGKRVLVIRFSSIGDIILTSPVVRCLKRQLPGAEVHFLTKKQFEPLLAANPHVDKTWLYDGDFSAILPGLKTAGFDFIIDLHRNLRSQYIRLRLGVPAASFPKLNVRKWMAVRLKADILPQVHIVDRYFRAVRPLSVENDGLGLNFFIPAGEEVDLLSLPEIFRDGFVAAVIGGRHHTKIFPPDKVAAVCSQLNLPVVLLGGPEDRERGEAIAGMTGGRALNACGRYTFNQSASLVRQARAVLTNDTGLMHVAAAFRKPVASVWGNTVPAFGMYPYMPGDDSFRSLMAEVEGLSCRPCSKLGYDACPKGHFRCMMDIDTEIIADFLNRQS